MNLQCEYIETRLTLLFMRDRPYDRAVGADYFIELVFTEDLFYWPRDMWTEFLFWDNDWGLRSSFALLKLIEN